MFEQLEDQGYAYVTAAQKRKMFRCQFIGDRVGHHNIFIRTILANAHVWEVFKNRHSEKKIEEIRHYSDGRKGFLQSVYDNIREGFSKDRELNENLRKFKEEKKKLETSDAIKKAREKFESIESETAKGSETFKKSFQEVKGRISETLGEVQKTEFVKKSMEFTEEISKSAGRATETILEQGKKISQSAPLKSVSVGVRAVKEEFDEAALSRARPYRAPEKLRKRSESLTDQERKIYEPDNESVGVVLHKDSKWYQSWTSFKDNNEYVNKIFDLKMKYDESNNVLIRGTRFFTDKLSEVFSGMFSKTEMSDVLTEICKIDPNFNIDKFILWCQFTVIPNILEAIGRGDEEVLKDWCYEAPFNLLIYPSKTAKSHGNRLDIRVLDVNHVDVAVGKIMEQGPVLIISFTAQELRVVRNKKGEVIEGSPDKILRVMYVWALCRDQEEMNPEAAWKILDVSSSAKEQWL